ncbi:Centromere/kinetochore protein zw10 [Cladorrhinum sp. PSN259]|nr:Centromere/kinetochore protein zw10 [Cladorrhinum sp. PSN259]
MDTPAQAAPTAQVAQALVDFSVDGAFPEENVSSLAIDVAALPEAIKALANAKAALQAEIHAINEETADDVHAWRKNAQSVQDDMLRSKALANEIIKSSEAPVVSGKALQEAEAKAQFLVRELSYNAQVQEALRGIKTVNQTLDQVEQARDERRILDALHLLEKSWKELDAIPVNRSCRAVKLLDIRAFELKSDVHEVFDRVWRTLIHVDVENQKVMISSSREDEPMTLADAVIGLQAYKEVDQRMEQLWKDINKAVLIPRMDITSGTLPGIHIQDNILELQASADKSVKSLFADLEKVLAFLVQRLPADLVETISSTLLPEVIHGITTVWLDSAVPSSLKDMERFQEIIKLAKDFCESLKLLGFSNFGDLQEWTESAPRVWLSKCREAALDTVRTRLSKGLGNPTRAEKIEKQMVSKSEGQQLAANGATADTDDDHGWGAWDDGEAETTKDTTGKPPEAGEDDGADAWGWGDEAGEEEHLKEETKKSGKEEEEDDAVEAWGWGDDGNDGKEQSKKDGGRSGTETRELTLKETYSISSNPQPILDLLFAIAEDGAALTDERYANSPVATAAAGLFGLPTLVLAMLRAVSPYYYSPQPGGNMYLYNDANWLADKLADFASAWKARDDISKRAQNMLRLDNDIKSLKAFANRAYTNEISVHKTILRDRLGGEQNVFQQDDTEACVSAAISHLRSMAVTWESVVARSVWQQAVGSLIDAVASKLITDVMELPSIGQDEAYNIAKQIAAVEELDDLFLSPGSKVPSTAQFASLWLRLKYLSEVLQSNLRDVRFLWIEGELSLYFTVDEVVDLVMASFEDNARTREVVKEIRASPNPKGGE